MICTMPTFFSYEYHECTQVYFRAESVAYKKESRQRQVQRILQFLLVFRRKNSMKDG